MGNQKTAIGLGTNEGDSYSGGEVQGEHSGWGDRVAMDVLEGNEQLERLVKNALLWSPFLKDLTFDVKASMGTVKLTGVSPYASLGRMAGTLAWTVPGVEDVINEIRVLSESNDRAPSPDPERSGFYRTTLWDSGL